MVSIAMKPVPPVTRTVLDLDAILGNKYLGVEVVDQILSAERIKSCSEQNRIAN
jgi:hypothetical protein